MKTGPSSTVQLALALPAYCCEVALPVSSRQRRPPAECSSPRTGAVQLEFNFPMTKIIAHHEMHAKPEDSTNRRIDRAYSGAVIRCPTCEAQTTLELDEATND